MENMTFLNILEGKFLTVPHENRGYVWTEKELKTLLRDLDGLADNRISDHYMGKIVLLSAGIPVLLDFKTKKLEYYNLVDGYQRLFSCHMILISILDFLEKMESHYYPELRSDFRIRTHFSQHPNDLQKLDRIVQPEIESKFKDASVSHHQIIRAYSFINSFLDEVIKEKEKDAENYLLDFLDALLRKLKFSLKISSSENEHSAAYQVNIHKGKPWSVLDLLKSYLYQWTFLNCSDNEKQAEMRDEIHEYWSGIHVTIKNEESYEEECLKVAWILILNNRFDSWEGFNGFQRVEVFPLKNFSTRTREDTRDFIMNFVKQLPIISEHYAAVMMLENKLLSETEGYLLNQIKETANFSVFLPLIIAARIQCDENQSILSDYEKLLKSIEVLSYELFPWESDRRQKIEMQIHNSAKDVYSYTYNLNLVAGWIHSLRNLYSPEK